MNSCEFLFVPGLFYLLRMSIQLTFDVKSLGAAHSGRHDRQRLALGFEIISETSR